MRVTYWCGRKESEASVEKCEGVRAATQDRSVEYTATRQANVHPSVHNSSTPTAMIIEVRPRIAQREKVSRTRTSCGSWHDAVCHSHRRTALTRYLVPQPAGLTASSYDAARFGGVLACPSVGLTGPAGDERKVVGPTTEGCRAARTSRALQLQQQDADEGSVIPARDRGRGRQFLG
jgi:hypothetical protein